MNRRVLAAPTLGGGGIAAPRAAVAVMALGCGVLTARPVLVGIRGAPPASVLLPLFLGLLAVGVLWPGPPAVRPGAGAATVLLVGVGAFVVGRVLASGPAPVPAASGIVIGMNTLAAVAEEAFFRRLVYGALLAGGPGAALVGSSLLFAAVHVTVYGLWVLPLDLAAGLLLGWQRQVTGSWAVPAVTHAVANLLVVL